MIGLSGLDFHEDKRLFVFGNNVDFAEFGAIVLLQNLVTVFFKMPDGDGFTGLAEFLPLV